MSMWDKSCDHHFLPVHSHLLGRQLGISGWCSATFILDIFGKFRRNLSQNAVGQNSDFQLGIHYSKHLFVPV